MALGIETGEAISSLLLVKALLAILAVLLFVYYKFYWDRAKHHLQIHHFFTKWRAVRHAVVLGLAAVGFAVGFSVELFGSFLGLTPNWARFVSSVFEIGSQFCLLSFFFSLAVDDVPHFQHVAESARRRHHAQAPQVLVQRVAQENAGMHKKRTAKKAMRRKRRR